MAITGDGTAAGGALPLHTGAANRAPVNRAPAQAAGKPADPVGETVGYRGPTACAAAGITYRQLDYWARTGLVEPSVRPAYGSGTQRLYSFRDVVVLKIVKRLLDTGVSLQNIRTAVQHLASRELPDLAQMTLMSDGATVYECTSPDEVVDLLQGGQGSSVSPSAWSGGMWRPDCRSSTESAWTPGRPSSATTPTTSWPAGGTGRSRAPGRYDTGADARYGGRAGARYDAGHGSRCTARAELSRPRFRPAERPIVSGVRHHQ